LQIFACPGAEYRRVNARIVWGTATVHVPELR
jgi:uncharacterized protein with HEPN domain